MTTLRSAIFLSTILSAFSRAASVDDGGAVLVVVEHRDVEQLLQALLDLEALGRGDVLEVDAAEHRGDALDRLDDLVGRRCTSRQIGKPSTPAKCLNSSALPSMTGRDASGPMSPRPSTAVPSVTMATVFFLIVRSCDPVGLGRDGVAHPGDARRVGHRQVVAVGDRHAGEDLDLAAVVHEEGAVEQLEHLARRRCPRPPPEPAAMCASSRQLTTRSSSSAGPRTSKPPRAVMLPPASPTAVARRPSEPGRLSSRTRRRIEYAAVGDGTDGR